MSSSNVSVIDQNSLAVNASNVGNTINNKTRPKMPNRLGKRDGSFSNISLISSNYSIDSAFKLADNDNSNSNSRQAIPRPNSTPLTHPINVNLNHFNIHQFNSTADLIRSISIYFSVSNFPKNPK